MWAVPFPVTVLHVALQYMSCCDFMPQEYKVPVFGSTSEQCHARLFKTGTFCLRSQFPLFLAGCSPWKRSAISLFHSNLFTSAPSGLTQPTSAGELNHKHTLQPASSHKLFSKSTLVANNLKIAAVCKWCSQGLVRDTDQLHPDWYEFMYVSPPPRSKPGWGTCSLPKCSLMTEFSLKKQFV